MAHKDTRGSPDAPDVPATPGTPDTVELPLSPIAVARERGDFARLILKNRSAILAFHTIAQTLKLDPEWSPHASQFIYTDETQSQALSQWEVSSDTGTDMEEKMEKIWTGYYRFNFELLPHIATAGWILGGGRRDLKDHGVDYLLSLERRKHHIHGRHARLRPHGEFGAVMLLVDEGRQAVLNGKSVEGAQRAVTSLSSTLSLGDLNYELEFTQLQETQYREKLQRMRIHLSQTYTKPPPSLELSPLDTHYEYRGFAIQSPFASGGYGVVAPGREIATGKAVAIKRLSRTPQSLAQIELEVRIYRVIGNHPNLCQLVADFYSGGDAVSTGTSSINDVYLIHSPLAQETFVDLTVSSSSFNVRLEAFRQALEGIAHLHRHGIMHRDIKPSNLMIVSYEPVHAIVIDYGTATFEPTSKDHYKGTIPYLAPEVLSLKRNNGVGPAYNCLVDIWGLGLSGYQLFFNASCVWKNGMTQGILSTILHSISTRSLPSIILKGMLAWDRSRRSSAAKLLLLEAWPEKNIPPTDAASPEPLGTRSSKRLRQ